MSLYKQKGFDLKAVEMFREMINRGVCPNSSTYTVVIDHLASIGKFEAALEVFDILPLMRIRRTSKQYLILTQGFTESKQFEVVKRLLKEMKSDGIPPGHGMRMSLDSIREAGLLKETEDFVKVLLPDERIGDVGFSGDYSDDEDEALDEMDRENDGSVDGVRLKPWFDPSALANALNVWSCAEISSLENAKFVWTTKLVCKVLRYFKKSGNACNFFWWVANQPGEFTHDVYTISWLIANAARHGEVDYLLLSKVKAEGMHFSFSTVRLMIDLYGISRKPDAALEVFGDVESLTGGISKSNLMLLCSSLFRTLIKCRNGWQVIDSLEEMIISGILPDIQTFTELIQHFVLEKDLRAVDKLFGMIRQNGIEPDANMFRILIHFYCKNYGTSALAFRLYEDMMSMNLIPDGATKALLLNTLFKQKKWREASVVLGEINDIHQLALPSHVWTLSTADLTRVYDIYSDAFTTNGD
ncbi:hypothetical protein MKW94_023217 [Papaver nudicaule]|uniref:Pentatricopeptide repeat-containing protein n=1 Tax=Papaver nudicaule TaxID=74823 RepID=A0AA41RWW8_PAPNU|nr:hypothetical protein [Papaver nudicaule]